MYPQSDCHQMCAKQRWTIAQSQTGSLPVKNNQSIDDQTFNKQSICKIQFAQTNV